MDEARYIAEAKLMHKINTKPDKEPNPGFIPLRPCLDPYHYIGTDKLHLTVQPTVQQSTQDPVTTVEHHEEDSRHIVQLGMWEAVREDIDRRIGECLSRAGGEPGQRFQSRADVRPGARLTVAGPPPKCTIVSCSHAPTLDPFSLFTTLPNHPPYHPRFLITGREQYPHVIFLS